MDIDYLQCMLDRYFSQEMKTTLNSGALPELLDSDCSELNTSTCRTMSGVPFPLRFLEFPVASIKSQYPHRAIAKPMRLQTSRCVHAMPVNPIYRDENAP